MAPIKKINVALASFVAISAPFLQGCGGSDDEGEGVRDGGDDDKQIEQVPLLTYIDKVSCDDLTDLLKMLKDLKVENVKTDLPNLLKGLDYTETVLVSKTFAFSGFGNIYQYARDHWGVDVADLLPMEKSARNQAVHDLITEKWTPIADAVQGEDGASALSQLQNEVTFWLEGGLSGDQLDLTNWKCNDVELAAAKNAFDAELEKARTPVIQEFVNNQTCTSLDDYVSKAKALTKETITNDVPNLVKGINFLDAASVLTAIKGLGLDSLLQDFNDNGFDTGALIAMSPSDVNEFIQQRFVEPESTDALAGMQTAVNGFLTANDLNGSCDDDSFGAALTSFNNAIKDAQKAGGKVKKETLARAAAAKFDRNSTITDIKDLVDVAIDKIPVDERTKVTINDGADFIEDKMKDLLDDMNDPEKWVGDYSKDMLNFLKDLAEKDGDVAEQAVDKLDNLLPGVADKFKDIFGKNKKDKNTGKDKDNGKDREGKHGKGEGEGNDRPEKGEGKDMDRPEKGEGKDKDHPEKPEKGDGKGKDHSERPEKGDGKDRPGKPEHGKGENAGGKGKDGPILIDLSNKAGDGATHMSDEALAEAAAKAAAAAKEKGDREASREDKTPKKGSDEDNARELREKSDFNELRETVKKKLKVRQNLEKYWNWERARKQRSPSSDERLRSVLAELL